MIPDFSNAQTAKPQAPTHANPSLQRTRAAGIAIAAAAIVSTIFVSLDQGGGGTTHLEILQGIARLQDLKELVHAVAIASVCAMAFGYATFARRLGLHRPEVLAGLTLYLFGSAAMIGATILDGFVTPHVAVDAITATPERLAFAYNLVHYLNIILNDLAKVAWVLQAAGTVAWSVTLLHGRAFNRAIGSVGLLSSALVLGLLATSPTSVTMTALLSILVAQVIWDLAAATWLMRGPVAAAQPMGVQRHALAS